MNIRMVPDAFSRWIDGVAATVNALFDRFGSHREVRLTEENDNTFAFDVIGGKKNSQLSKHRNRVVDAALAEPLPADWVAALRGSRIELVLRPERFLFRPLELPKRAADFLQGIIRAQIDRLTPWTANDAVFNCTRPTDVANDRIHVTIAATARTVVAPYVAAFAGVGAASVVVSALVPDASPAAAPIVVFAQRPGGAFEIGRVRRVLATVFVSTALAAVISIGAGAVVGGYLDSAQTELSRKIAARRAAMRIGLDVSGGTAQSMLERRKRATPSSVIVIEALSRLLPDHTYVTELRIDGDKVQVVGITRDAPSLIQLIEQSPHFTSATFFAPTTQTPGDPGERFHIEARIKPDFTLGT